MKVCPHCGNEFRYNVVVDRRTKFKYLRSGCCDVALRSCPDPEMLMRSAHLSEDERDYLKRLIPLPWFGGQIVAVLLQLEAKVQQASKEVVA
ncbi:hypothetical protein [Tolypothrix sp. VBCCA 56010]|uniref:hypothetical protein n=1 Tax=Tolypothrix sp. VBCCA 56010 TaxID=3137731 RepID=UPI003D7D4FCC